MGGLTSSLGFGAGGDNASAGANFVAGSTPLIQTVNGAQLGTGAASAQNALDQQQAFVNALAAQNGIQNQTNVYNQLQGVANGTGPNPALAALNQATGANIANQAALMAGQRGTNANPGLIARQAAMQGGNLQQQAAGQGATLQAQQSLNAMNQLGGISGQQIANQAGALQNYNTANQNLYGMQLGAAGQLNNANVSQQSSQNSANAGVANTVAGGQQKMAGNLLGGAGAALGLFADGGAVQKFADGGASVPNDYLSTTLYVAPPSNAANGPQSNVGQFHAAQSAGSPILSGANFGGNQSGQDALAQGSYGFGQGLGNAASKLYNSSFGDSAPTQMAGGAADTGEFSTQPGAAGLLKSLAPIAAMLAAKGGQVPALVSPGERYLPPDEVKEVAKGKKNPMAAGEKIPGKAAVKGDSLKNDTVPKTLESGGIVIPRSITEGKNAPQKSKEFVAAILRKKGKLGV